MLEYSGKEYLHEGYKEKVVNWEILNKPLSG